MHVVGKPGDDGVGCRQFSGLSGRRGGIGQPLVGGLDVCYPCMVGRRRDRQKVERPVLIGSPVLLDGNPVRDVGHCVQVSYDIGMQGVALPGGTAQEGLRRRNGRVAGDLGGKLEGFGQEEILGLDGDGGQQQEQAGRQVAQHGHAVEGEIDGSAESRAQTPSMPRYLK